MGRRIRILSYNIHKGFCTFNRFTLHRIKEAIRETRADLCFLQEVVGENHVFASKINNWPSEAQFEFLADTIWPHYKYGQNATFPDRHHGNALLSKYPILMSENISLSTNRYEQRGLLHCRIHLPAENGFPEAELDLLNTHLNLLHSSRVVQTRRIIDWAKTTLQEDSPLVLAGDFNDWQGALSPLFHEGLRLQESFLLHVGEHAKSFPSQFPMMTLDRIYIRGLRVASTSVLNMSPWIDLSDHLPLFVECELP